MALHGPPQRDDVSRITRYCPAMSKSNLRCAFVFVRSGCVVGSSLFSVWLGLGEDNGRANIPKDAAAAALAGG